MVLYCKLLHPFIIGIGILFASYGASYCQKISTPNNSYEDQNLYKKKTIKILSIDGGGIRGVVPALILKNLESRLKKKKLAECFDLMAGTSTGGIIVLLLSIPDTERRQKYSAKNVYDLYKSLGMRAFEQTMWQYLKTFNGWMDEKYPSKNLESLLEEYYGNLRLSQSTTNVLIPAYDIGANKAVLLSSAKAKTHKESDFYMKDVARATSAAPTYFKPAKIKDETGQEHIFIDGGIVSNNPALDACLYAIELYGKDNDFLIISLGTGSGYGSSGRDYYTDSKSIRGGKFQWAPDITSLLMYSSSDIVDNQLETFLNTQLKTQYYRLQINLDLAHSQMDDTSVENIETLVDYAQKLIYEYDDKLDSIAEMLEKIE